nr:putative pectinesterase/pectinesterase inhibitor 54 [Quercus suber]POF26654.1 putative pectinesterase/pectinesterase inhibitor 54 [Quercus suber]
MRMGLLVFWVLGLCALGLGGASISWAAMNDNQNYVKECSFTRYPSLCVETLTRLGSANQPVNIVLALVNKTISETKLTTSNFAKFSSQFEAQELAERAHYVTGYREELMNMSLKWLEQSMLALKDSPAKNKHDIQTWLSAALTFQQDCKDSADSLSLSEEINIVQNQISKKMDYLSQLGNRKLVEAKANVIVAKDGSGNYKTVSEAIKAASGKRFVIYVKSGVYKEKIYTKKDGITLIGDGKYSTIILGDDCVAKGSSLAASATFTITGNGFIARDIGFHNTAGPQGEQALAVYIASDHSVLFRCSIAGYQDSLYAVVLHQFYRECDIYGTIDFIFGNAVAVFQSCNLVLRRPQRGYYNVILANGRNDPVQNTGFSVQKCKIMVSSDFSAVKHSYNSYLGRPWKQYSRAVIMESTLDDAIAPRGPGAGLSKRVQWSGYHVIGADEAVKFTVSKFIAGTTWLPFTGIPFISGLD